jgi:hypothetical protein
MKEFLIQYWPLIAIIFIAIIGIIYTFVRKPQQIKHWLVWACAQAEAALGSQTGQLKLRQVYDAFTAKYPFFSLFITFERFSGWVDLALNELQEWIENNPKIAEKLGEDK